MVDLVSTLEIATLVILPLLVFYQRGPWRARSYVICLIPLYLIWFASYALLHELSHLIMAVMTGETISDYQLIPRFWEGDYKTAWVNSFSPSNLKRLSTLSAPYLRDLAFLAIGFVILRRKRGAGPFTSGLLLILFVLSPLYDLVNNFSMFLLGASNDFRLMANIVGARATWIGGAASLVFAATILWKVLEAYEHHRDQGLMDPSSGRVS